ncbi:GL14166 [Drosophila persimilis]|uniref:GL14166 n=1 Tax=Drosophila persimilis TaxID=7234 RepID=B4GQI0_DROPE|nr:GL14166 [Drosophila persimilis]
MAREPAGSSRCQLVRRLNWTDIIRRTLAYMNRKTKKVMPLVISVSAGTQEVFLATRGCDLLK